MRGTRSAVALLVALAAGCGSRGQIAPVDGSTVPADGAMVPGDGAIDGGEPGDPAWRCRG